MPRYDIITRGIKRSAFIARRDVLAEQARADAAYAEWKQTEEGRNIDVWLPSGGIAHVSPDVSQETLDALDEMVRAVRDALAKGWRPGGPGPDAE